MQAAGSASQGGRATLPGSFGQGPPVSAAGPPLPRAWGPRSTAAGFSGRTACRSERAPPQGEHVHAPVRRVGLGSSGALPLLSYTVWGCCQGTR